MRSIKLSLAVAAIIVMGALAAVACGDETTGMYKFERLSVGDNTYKIGDVYEEASTQPLSEDFCSLELKSDGTATFSFFKSNEPLKGKWTTSDDENEIVVTSDQTTVTFIKSGETLTFSTDGVTVTLKK